MTEVREVVPLPRVTFVPSAPAALVGVWNLRGEVVPLLDTAALVGVEGTTPRFAVVTRTARGVAGFTATAIPVTADLDVRDDERGGPVADLGDRIVRLVGVDDLLAGI